MKRSLLKKTLSVILALSLATAFSLPATALAVDSDVDVANNHAATGSAKTVSDITIDGVNAPTPFGQLDDKAVVDTAEDETWEIPTLWVNDDLELSTVADDDASNLPALVFFLPDGLTVEGDSFTITLSESVAKLFGDEDLIALYDDEMGVTYILPESILSYFDEPTKDTFDAKSPYGGWMNVSALMDEYAAANGEKKPRSLVDIYCSQTVRSVVSESELNYLIDLVINKFEPQAVELLKKSFPAFGEAAKNNQIGKQIGLYIYYLKGDKDGVAEHESASEALAYVAGDAFKKDGKITYGYMIGIDVDDLLVRDANGKLVFERDGDHAITFNNTIVHELFHAFMDDYNRTGMLGAKTIEDGYTPGGNFVDQGQQQRFSALIYPKWFREGTASAVENVYQFRIDAFKMLRATSGYSNVFNDTYTRDNLIYNYLNAKKDGNWQYFELEYSDSGESSGVNTTQSRYVTGYLAALYLAQLAAQNDPGIGSAMKINTIAKDTITFEGDSAMKLRLGLDSILKRMHNGETLDQVIADISADDDKNPRYSSVADFEKKFIKGVKDENEVYQGDEASLYFVLPFLNYMRSLEKEKEQGKRSNLPNGSILFEFNDDFNVPLDFDLSKQWTSDNLKIVESNRFVESTVPSSVALAGGGKSALPATATQSSTPLTAASASELPLAAKANAVEATEVAGAVGAAGAVEVIDTTSEPDEATEVIESELAAIPEVAPSVELEGANEPETVSEPEEAAGPESASEPEATTSADPASE